MNVARYHDVANDVWLEDAFEMRSEKSGRGKEGCGGRVEEK